MRKVRRAVSQVLSATGIRPPNSPHDSVVRDTTTDIAQNSPSDDIPANILAFRTITKLLSLIQQDRSIEPQETWHPDATKQRELQIINALATVAVIEHEVVAVVNNHYSDVLDPELGPPKLSVVAIVDPPHEKNIAPPSPSWKVMITQNLRRCTLKPSPSSPTEHPVITDVEALAGLNLADDEAINNYVDHHWSDMNMSRHLWIISKLLGMKAPVNPDAQEHFMALTRRLQCHTIATCFAKLERRFTLPGSILFLKSLESIKVWEFDEAQRGQLSTKEISNDKDFAVNFLLPLKELAADFPNLFHQAALIKQNKDNKLYTKETCLEFHAMLLFRIEDFKQSLLVLKGIKRTAKPPAKCTPAFRLAVLRAAASGHMLQRLIKSAALKMHLKTIAPFLKRDDPISSSKPFWPQGPGEDLEERDEDIEVVCKSVKEGDSLVESYLNWLKLLIAHFDAISILVGYVTGPEFKYSGISIELVVPPRSEPIILSWRSLLSDATLFPITTDPDIRLPNVDYFVTNETLIKFLTGAVEALPQFKRAQKCWQRGEKEETINCFQMLKQTKVKVWTEWAGGMVDKLKADNSPFVWLFNDGSDKWAHDIADEIEQACRSTAFFDALSKEREFEFGGTIHCEACLASLLAEGSLVSEGTLAQMKGFGPVIGVSRRCCPVCQALLSLLSDPKLPFVVRGFHKTVTACTLPTWLPKETVDKMNSIFGSRLRKELVELMFSPESMRNRTQSTGSRRLSSDSTEPSDRAIWRQRELSEAGYN